MDFPRKHGTIRNALFQAEAIAKKNGRKVKDQRHRNDPPIPQAGAEAWDVFWQLCSSTPSDEPISFQEIQAWSDLYRTRLQPWEVSAIRHLDHVYDRTVARIERDEAEQQ